VSSNSWTRKFADISSRLTENATLRTIKLLNVGKRDILDLYRYHRLETHNRAPAPSKFIQADIVDSKTFEHDAAVFSQHTLVVPRKKQYVEQSTDRFEKKKLLQINSAQLAVELS